MTKKILSVVLALMLVLSVAAIGMSAADAKFKVTETGSVAGKVTTDNSWDGIHFPWSVGTPDSSVYKYDTTKLPGSTTYFIKVVSKNYAKLYKGKDANGTFMTDLGINTTTASVYYAGVQFQFRDVTTSSATPTAPGVGSWIRFTTTKTDYVIGVSSGVRTLIWEDCDGVLFKGASVEFAPGDFAIDDTSFSKDVFDKNGYYTVEIDYTGDMLTITGPQGQVRQLARATTVKTVETDPNDASKTAVVTTFTIDGVKFSLTNKTIKNGDYFVLYYNASGVTTTSTAASKTSTSGGTTPKTGDNNAALAFAGLALISAAAVVVSKKRSK